MTRLSGVTELKKPGVWRVGAKRKHMWSYTSSGPSTSTYYEGNATVQYKNIPLNWTYNTTTNEPQPPAGSSGKRRVRRGMSKPLPIRRTKQRRN